MEDDTMAPMSPKQATLKGKAKNTHVRIPEDLYESIAAEAFESGLSINALIIRKLEKTVVRRVAKKK